VNAAAGSSVDFTRDELDAVRTLLEDPQTWSQIGGGTVEHLAASIAACLAPRDGRTAEDSRTIGLTVARGLLEFAVADLDPKLFQQVLFARLERMESGQASTLDHALLNLHGDLLARFADVTQQLKVVLDRLPPGTAQRSQIAIYLRALIDWLNTDPWPQHRWFKGQPLNPTTIERRMRVRAAGSARDQVFEADELVKQCQRLVILGGPGFGKTWLARRTARRCAEDAIEALVAGTSLDEVELPLYTTCSRLMSADGDVRQATVSSALSQLGDLGGSRITEALRVLFTERNAPTVLIIDSLDEAGDSTDRLRQVGTLPWRIILTSRPISWNQQLALKQGDDSQRVVELQPLMYPYEVNAVIRSWFDGQPGFSDDLIDQIARRRDLQQASTVPLILAFYCIIGGGRSLPESRTDLYTMVIKRLLTGYWRGSRRIDEPDVETCLRVLRTWAWTGAETNHAISGVGTWTEDIATPPIQVSAAEADALDHIATPVEPPDLDSRMTRRQFIHRSIREHLVAEYVAKHLAADKAADALLPHLWFDPDWENAAPVALAMHPQRNHVLRDLICRATISEDIPTDISAVDSTWELRRLLARVANESNEADWSPEISRMIGRARVDLVRTGRASELAAAASWATSTRQAREELLALLSRHTASDVTERLLPMVVALAPTAEDKRGTRKELLRLLERQRSVSRSEQVADGVVQLGGTQEDRRQIRHALLPLLARQTDVSQAKRLADRIVQLSSTAEDKREVCQALLNVLGHLNDRADIFYAGELVARIGELASTPEDERQTLNALLRLIAVNTNPKLAEHLAHGIGQLHPAEEDTRQARMVLVRRLEQLCAGGGSAVDPQELVAAFVSLTPTVEEKRPARKALLELLSHETNVLYVSHIVRGLAQLAPTPLDRRLAQDALLALIASESDPIKSFLSVDALVADLILLCISPSDRRRVRVGLIQLLREDIDNWRSRDLVKAVSKLARTTSEKRETRETLLRQLACQTIASTAMLIAHEVVQLGPTIDDQRQAREVLLRILADESDAQEARELVRQTVQLGATPEDKRQARHALLWLLAQGSGGWMSDLVDEVVQLSATDGGTRETRQALLQQLAGETDAFMAYRLANGLLQLELPANGRRKAREALLQLLTVEADAFLVDTTLNSDQLINSNAEWLARAILQFDATPEDRRRTRELLLRLMHKTRYGLDADASFRTLAQLSVTAEDKRQVREGLLQLLASHARFPAYRLVSGIVQGIVTSDDRQQARRALLELVSAEANTEIAADLLRGVLQLSVSATDRDQAKKAVLRVLVADPGGRGTHSLIRTLTELSMTPEDKRQAREALLRILAIETNRHIAKQLVAGLIALNPTADDRSHAHKALNRLLARPAPVWQAEELLQMINQLDPSPEAQRAARESLVRRLAEITEGMAAEAIVQMLIRLGATEEDKREAREAFLRALANEDGMGMASRLVGNLQDLIPTFDDKQRARRALMRLLAVQTNVDAFYAYELVKDVMQLGATTDEKRQTRETLMRFLAADPEAKASGWLIHGLVLLEPTIGDLATWYARRRQPPIELLAAVRRNTPLASWISNLHS